MRSENPTRVRLWSIRPYVLWLISDTANGLAFALVSFAIPMLALVLTDDPAAAGTIAAVGVLTRLLSSIAGGIIADRFSRTRLMIMGGILGSIATAIFTILAAMGSLSFVALLIFEFVLALRAGLFGVAGEAVLKDVVPASVMGRAQAANQGRDAALNLAGSPLGGVLLGVGAWLLGAVMLIAKVLGTIFAWLLGRAEPRAARAPIPAEPAEGGRSAWREFREGLVWVWNRRDLRMVVLVISIINLGLGLTSATVVYGMQQSGVPIEVIGLASGLIGVGMLLGAFLAPFIVTRINVGVVLVVGIGAMAVMPLILKGQEDPLGIALVLGIGIMTLPAVNAGMSGYLLVATPTELMGRVTSVLQIVGMGLAPLAPLIAGFGLAHIGRSGTLSIAFAISALAFLVGLLASRVRQIPTESEWRRYAEENGTPPLEAEDETPPNA